MQLFFRVLRSGYVILTCLVDCLVNNDPLELSWVANPDLKAKKTLN
jgi:hypothetical protein